MNKLYFASDYQEGAHEKILERLLATNREHTVGYGNDEYSLSAKEKIRAACECPEAEIYFLIGGTQTNATAIDGILESYEGVIAATTGHISLHEAGAIEFCGHKVIELPAENGKLKAETVRDYLSVFHGDSTKEHMVWPGMVYISQSTEYGTIYSKAELTALREVCDEYGIRLYMDGARLAYALMCEENDLSLPDIARLCDAFYIGGTKCGALFGEALVFTRPHVVKHFFTTVKQHGALLAKGRINGVQFDTLFTDGLYFEIGKYAIEKAAYLKAELIKKGYSFFIDSPTNQIFVIMDDKKLEKLSEKVEFSYWERYDESRSVIRFATCWATEDKDIEELLKLL